MNKFNLMDEVFYLDFHVWGVDICQGIVTGMRVTNELDMHNCLKKNQYTIIEYKIQQTFDRKEIEGGYSYQVSGDQELHNVIYKKVFETYEQAFDYLNNYVQEKKR